MEIKINTWRDPYDAGFTPTRPTSITLQSGVTVLVGCNGAGKTTLLHNIKSEIKPLYPYCSFDNLHDGGNKKVGSLLYNSGELGEAALLLTSSEGENIKNNLYHHAQLYEEFVKTGYYKDTTYRFAMMFKDNEEITTNIRFFFYDGTDSGMSIDNIEETKTFFSYIIALCEKHNITPFIIITANDYAMCDEQRCLDVNTGTYKTFKTYNAYKKFILNSRARKEKRIQAQIKYVEKEKEKEKKMYEKMCEKINKPIQKIKEKAENEGRELTHNEQRDIDNLTRSLCDFERSLRFYVKV